MALDQYKVSVPEGIESDWKVERFIVDEQESNWHTLTELLGGMGGRGCPPGTYTRLKHHGAVIMSDTPAEIRDHLHAIRQAKGNVLINGLGLGVVLQACLMKTEVQDVIVIELSQDVINLVAPHYKERFGDRITIINADALTWQPPKHVRYGMVWHDIWPTICTDNLPEMHKLHRKYGRRCDWQGSWAREICERVRREENHYRW